MTDWNPDTPKWKGEANKNAKESELPSPNLLNDFKEQTESSSNFSKPTYFEIYDPLVNKLEPWIVMVAFIVGLGIYFVEHTNRIDERRVRAWQLVTTSAPGNSGKISALEYLLSIGEPLNGIDLSVKTGKEGTYLRRVRLSDAELVSANFSGADLRRANLSGANLGKANLSDADLEEAILSNATLLNTIFAETKLEGANLSGAKGLNQDQLETACGNKETILPENLEIKTCKVVEDDNLFYIDIDDSENLARDDVPDQSSRLPLHSKNSSSGGQ